MVKNSLAVKKYQFIVHKDKNEKFLHFCSFMKSSIFSVQIRGNYYIYFFDISENEEKLLFDKVQPEFL